MSSSYKCSKDLIASLSPLSISVLIVLEEKLECLPDIVSLSSSLSVFYKPKSSTRFYLMPLPFLSISLGKIYPSENTYIIQSSMHLKIHRASCCVQRRKYVQSCLYHESSYMGTRQTSVTRFQPTLRFNSKATIFAI